MSTKLNVVQASKNPWYADGLQFTCSQCGNCCTGGPGYVWISTEEIGRLAAHLQISPKEVVDRHCRKIGARYSLNEHRNSRGEFDCTFLEERQVEREQQGQVIRQTQRVCTIYPVRPLQCRTWPFWEGNLASTENWELASKRCHGMNRGRHFSAKEAEALRDASDWPDAPPSSERP